MVLEIVDLVPCSRSILETRMSAISLRMDLLSNLAWGITFSIARSCTGGEHISSPLSVWQSVVVRRSYSPTRTPILVSKLIKCNFKVGYLQFESRSFDIDDAVGCREYVVFVDDATTTAKIWSPFYNTQFINSVSQQCQCVLVWYDKSAIHGNSNKTVSLPFTTLLTKVSKWPQLFGKRLMFLWLETSGNWKPSEPPPDWSMMGFNGQHTLALFPDTPHWYAFIFSRIAGEKGFGSLETKSDKVLHDWTTMQKPGCLSGVWQPLDSKILTN